MLDHPRYLKKINSVSKELRKIQWNYFVARVLRKWDVTEVFYISGAARENGLYCITKTDVFPLQYTLSEMNRS